MADLRYSTQHTIRRHPSDGKCLRIDVLCGVGDVFRFPFYSPLRSLSRVASDYSSDSVVCIVTLRPLRPLREIKDNSVFVLHAECAKSAEIYFPSVFHAGAGVVVNFVTTRVRREFCPLCGRCTQSPNVAMGIATLTRHRLTSQSIFQGPRSPYLPCHRLTLNAHPLTINSSP